MRPPSDIFAHAFCRACVGVKRNSRRNRPRRVELQVLTFPSSRVGFASRPRYAQVPAPSNLTAPHRHLSPQLTACCLPIIKSHLQELFVRVLLADNSQVAANAVLLPSVGEVPANLCLWACCHFRHLAGKQGVAGLLLSMATLQTL